MVEITLKISGYTLTANQQMEKDIWLVREYSGKQVAPINTFATNTKLLTRMVKTLMKDA